MSEEEKEVAEAIGVATSLGDRIILVGTHQGASMLMANLAKNIKMAVMEASATLAVPPQRSFPRKAKKGRKRSY